MLARLRTLAHLALRIGLATIVATTGRAALAAGDWPRWRGPDGDNVSKETEWIPAGASEPLWRARIGRGYSSPIVAGGRVYATGFFPHTEGAEEGVDRVFCLDAETGKEIWSTSYPALAYANEHAGGALSTPTLSDGVLFVATRSGELCAFAAEDGALAWKADLAERHEVDPGRYGFASSPFVRGSDVIVNAGRAIALDRETGDTIWVSDPYDASYSTVAPVQLGERACLAVFGGAGLVLIDAADGTHVHTYVFRNNPRNVEGATPIVLGTSVFVSSGYEQGAALVSFAGDEPALVWRSRVMRNKMAGCTLFEGHLYGFDESMLKCIDLEGNERWRRRGLGHGALSIAGRSLLLTSSEGELIVAEASPLEYREQSRRRVIEGGVFWTAPVLANGRILVRGSEGELVCLDHRRADSVASALGVEREPAKDAELPAPAELARRHLAATGLAAGIPAGLRLSGRLHIDALGFHDVAATWEIGDGRRWRARFDLPPGIGGTIERAFDGDHGWEINPYRGGALIVGPDLAELRRTGGFRELFEPLPAGNEARTAGIEDFRGTRCYRVDVELAPEIARQIYFDATSSLLAGRTSAHEATVVLGDWRRAGELLLPFHRTVFHPDTGEEQRWRFDAAEQVELDATRFEPPADLAAKLAELEAEEARAARAEHEK